MFKRMTIFVIFVSFFTLPVAAQQSAQGSPRATRLWVVPVSWTNEAEARRYLTKLFVGNSGGAYVSATSEYTADEVVRVFLRAERETPYGEDGYVPLSPKKQAVAETAIIAVDSVAESVYRSSDYDFLGRMAKRGMNRAQNEVRRQVVPPSVYRLYWTVSVTWEIYSRHTRAVVARGEAVKTVAFTNKIINVGDGRTRHEVYLYSGVDLAEIGVSNESELGTRAFTLVGFIVLNNSTAPENVAVDR